MAHYPEYDYLVVNDLFEEALEELRAVVTCQRLRLAEQVVRLERKLQALLTGS
jgi:guanylate kinase